MARLIPHHGEVRDVATPLTLTDLQIYVGGFILFIELSSGDLLIVNESAEHFTPMNKTATTIAGQPVYGDVVLCESGEIA
jgi:hypothetical protein